MPPPPPPPPGEKRRSYAVLGLAALAAASVVYWIAFAQASVEEIRVGLRRNDPGAAAGYTNAQRLENGNTPIGPVRRSP